jgi:hypothetical protein
MSSETSTVEEQIAAANFVSHFPQMDLAPIRNRIAREHTELTPEYLDRIERRYLQFLMQCKIERGNLHEPDKDVDLYWHAHILHTEQYMMDCQRYFGYFLHHRPNTDGEKCDDACGAIGA